MNKLLTQSTHKMKPPAIPRRFNIIRIRETDTTPHSALQKHLVFKIFKKLTSQAMFMAAILSLSLPAVAMGGDGKTAGPFPTSAEEMPTSMPIDWNDTGWSRWELASLDIGYMNGAFFAGLRGFGYHRTWFPKVRRLGLGVDIMEYFASKAPVNDTERSLKVATETGCFFPIRLTYVLFGKMKVEQEALYEILSRRQSLYYTHYRYRELGSVPRTLVSPLVLVGVATSQWGKQAPSGSKSSEWNFSFWDLFIEVSFSTLLTEPPRRPMGGVYRITAGILNWNRKGTWELSAMRGTDFYIKVGFGGLAYTPRR